MIAANPDVIVAAGPIDAMPVHALTRTMPIVVIGGPDLIEEGLADSLARPGGNVTRIAILRGELDGKRLELLRELVPAATQVTFLAYARLPRSAARASAIEALARPLGLRVSARLVSEAAEAARVHVLPTLWFRNTWTWWPEQPKPSLQRMPGANAVTIETSHAELGGFLLHCDGDPNLLFTENDTNNEPIFGTPNASPFVKDAFHNYVVSGRQEAVNPNQTGPRLPPIINSTLAPERPPSSA